MGWALGFDRHWNRDVGYGVPAICDDPDCSEAIDRGIAHVCGGAPFGGEHGCGLHFCGAHLFHGQERQVCRRCLAGKEPFTPTPDTPEWLRWKLADPSWSGWRAENPKEVERMTHALASHPVQPAATQPDGGVAASTPST